MPDDRTFAPTGGQTMGWEYCVYKQEGARYPEWNWIDPGSGHPYLRIIMREDQARMLRRRDVLWGHLDGVLKNPVGEAKAHRVEDAVCSAIAAGVDFADLRATLEGLPLP